MRIAILAYGSLISDPGPYLDKLIVDCLPSKTPFGIEYARRSEARKGAPVLVPVMERGGRVDAKLLVLRESVDLQRAKNELYWREIHRRGKPYSKPPADCKNCCSIDEYAPSQVLGAGNLDLVITTRFPANIARPVPGDLARWAVESVGLADNGKDGISYLRDNINCGIETPLTRPYEDAILSALGADDLGHALAIQRKRNLAD